MLIDSQTKKYLTDKYSRELKEDVDLKVFTRDILISSEDPSYAQFSKGLVSELAQINHHIKAQYLSLGDQAAKELHLSFSPTIAVGRASGYSIQFWGVPAGQIASAFLETLSLVSQRESGLDASLKEKLKSIDSQLLIETYFSVDSPASSQAVLLSHRMAIERPDRILSRAIHVEEALELIQLPDAPAPPFVLINENRESLLSGLISQEKLAYQLILRGSSQKDALLAELEREERRKTMLVNDPDFPIVLTTSNFDEAVKKYPFLVVDCWAEWCAPCLMVHPIIENLAKKYRGEMAFAKLNIDQNREIAERFRIMSIPTLLVFKDEKNIDAIIGAMPQQALEERIRMYRRAGN